MPSTNQHNLQLMERGMELGASHTLRCRGNCAHLNSAEVMRTTECPSVILLRAKPAEEYKVPWEKNLVTCSFTVPTKTSVFLRNWGLEFHLIWSAPEVASSRSVTPHLMGPSSSSPGAVPQQLVEAHGACFWVITTLPGKARQKHGNQAFSQATSDSTRGSSLTFAGQSRVGYYEKCLHRRNG